MINMAQQLEQAAAEIGETIQYAVIGDHSYYCNIPQHPDFYNKVLPWSIARAALDYEYDDGFGGAECHPVYAWTESCILFIHEYDGATCVRKIPRNPTAVVPGFGGL